MIQRYSCRFCNRCQTNDFRAVIKNCFNYVCCNFAVTFSFIRTFSSLQYSHFSSSCRHCYSCAYHRNTCNRTSTASNASNDSCRNNSCCDSNNGGSLFYPPPKLTVFVGAHYRIIAAISEQIGVVQAVCGKFTVFRCVSVDEPMCYRVVISALEVIEIHNRCAAAAADRLPEYRICKHYSICRILAQLAARCGGKTCIDFRKVMCYTI